MAHKLPRTSSSHIGTENVREEKNEIVSTA